MAYKISSEAMGILDSWREKASRCTNLDAFNLFQLMTDLKYIVDISRDEKDRTWKDRPSKQEVRNR